MNKSILYVALLGSAFGASCMSSEDDPLGEASQNMISVNGTSLTGVAFSGTTLTGSPLAGTTLASVNTAGNSVTGTPITAISATAPPWSNSSLAGSTWTATASNGALVKLRVENGVIGAAPGPELWSYSVSYQTAAGWKPLCGLDGASQPIRAVAVAGTWNATALDAASYATSTTKFTLACRLKSIAKCVESGYKTYKGLTNQMTSCVRLLRGDYCGTGIPYTVDGTSVNVYDNAGVQADNQAWAPEAEWTPTGARCINTNNAKRYELALAKDPKCVTPLKTTTCGASFASGAILIDELATP